MYSPATVCSRAASRWPFAALMKPVVATFRIKTLSTSRPTSSHCNHESGLQPSALRTVRRRSRSKARTFGSLRPEICMVIVSVFPSADTS